MLLSGFKQTEDNKWQLIGVEVKTTGCHAYALKFRK